MQNITYKKSKWLEFFYINIVIIKYQRRMMNLQRRIRNCLAGMVKDYFYWQYNDHLQGPMHPETSNLF